MRPTCRRGSRITALRGRIGAAISAPTGHGSSALGAPTPEGPQSLAHLDARHITPRILGQQLIVPMAPIAEVYRDMPLDCLAPDEGFIAIPSPRLTARTAVATASTASVRGNDLRHASATHRVGGWPAKGRAQTT